MNHILLNIKRKKKLKQIQLGIQEGRTITLVLTFNELPLALDDLVAEAALLVVLQYK